MSKSTVLHLGYWYDFTDTDTADTSMEWDYRIGLNVADEKPIDADIGSDLADINDMTHWGGEIALLYNNFWAAGEWLWGEMDREGAGLRDGFSSKDSTGRCNSVEANMGYYELGATIGGPVSYTHLTLPTIYSV